MVYHIRTAHHIRTACSAAVYHIHTARSAVVYHIRTAHYIRTARSAAVYHIHTTRSAAVYHIRTAHSAVYYIRAAPAGTGANKYSITSFIYP